MNPMSSQKESSSGSPPSPSLPPLSTRTVGEIVAEDYGRAAVLRRHGIDFCCGGGKILADACTAKGIDPALVEAQLKAHDAHLNGEVGSAFEEAPTEPSALVDYIEEVHHDWTRESLTPLLHFTRRVATVHGAGAPWLRTVAERTEELAAEMVSHMQDEEAELFPRIREGRDEVSPAELDELESEHEHAGALMREIRSLTSNYTPPETACATWRAAYAKLAEFETDLERHVHLENNVLFPALRAASRPPARG